MSRRTRRRRLAKARTRARSALLRLHGGGRNASRDRLAEAKADGAVLAGDN